MGGYDERYLFYISERVLPGFSGPCSTYFLYFFLCLGYPLIYTFIYSNEVVRQVPVAVIDQSKSPFKP